jgi:AbrB family looped-hinge helix DNA binding protein
MKATLDKFGRIVLPKQVRDDLGLGPGSELQVDEQGDRIVLTPRRDQPDLVRERGVLVYAGEAVGDLEKAVEVQRAKRSRDLSGRSSR